MERVKYNQMQFYFILSSILLCPPPPGKWVPIGTVEGWIETVWFLHIGIQWPLLRILLIKAPIVDYNVLSNGMVFRRDVWYAFIISHPSLRVTAVVSYHKETDNFYLCQGSSSLPHLSTKTRKKRLRNEYIICYRLRICRPLCCPHFSNISHAMHIHSSPSFS